MNEVPRWFSVIWVPKLLLSPVKVRIFGPKTAKFGPKYAFLVIFGQILAFLIPVGWLVGGYVARSVSCKTHIYFI